MPDGEVDVDIDVDEVAVTVAVTVVVTVTVAVADTVAVTVAVADTVAVTVADSDADKVAVAVADGEVDVDIDVDVATDTVAITVAVTDADCVSDGDTLALTLCDGETERVTEPLRDSDADHEKPVSTPSSCTGWPCTACAGLVTGAPTHAAMSANAAAKVLLAAVPLAHTPDSAAATCAPQAPLAS